MEVRHWVREGGCWLGSGSGRKRAVAVRGWDSSPEGAAELTLLTLPTLLVCLADSYRKAEWTLREHACGAVSSRQLCVCPRP